jgi:hypothetical protein
MFRDRLRQWGMNDKNHRGNIDRRRKVTQSADNRDKITAQQDSCQPTASLKPTQPIMSVHQNLSSVLCTPKEMRMLHRALKGVLDWQKEFEDSTYTRDGNPIGQMLTDIQEALRWNYQKPLTCTKVSRQLQKTGAALQRRMKEPCGLLDIHQFVGALLQLAKRRNYSAWDHSTFTFLSKMAAEALSISHPSLLLFHLLLSEPTPAHLVMIYDVGCSVVHR